MSSPPETFQHRISESIRAHAMTFPETEEGASCVNRAFKAGGKNFVFLGEKDDTCTVRLKLAGSIDEVTELAAAEKGDTSYEVGSGGWTKLVFAADDHPPLADLERWITESFFLLAPRKVTKLVET